MQEDIIQVLRVVSYKGPRGEVEKQVTASLHGTRHIRKMQITAVTIGEFPDIIKEQPIDIRKISEDLKFYASALNCLNPYGGSISEFDILISEEL
jgi:hypothetical protein